MKLGPGKIRGAMRWAVVLIALAVLVDTAWTPVDAATPPKKPARVDPTLLAQAKANPNRMFEVIVEATTPKTVRELQAKKQQGQGQQGQSGKNDNVDRAGKAVQKTGDAPKRSLGIVGGTSAKMRGANILKLANDPDVAYIYADAQLNAKFDPQLAAPLVTEPGQLEVNAPAVWTQYGVIGRGVGVAILDSGIYAHPDLAGRVVAAIDFTTATPTVSPVPLGDPGGHGTHVAGLVAGDGTLSGGAYTGVAPGANLIDVRVINANGGSNVSTVLAGLQWVLKNRTTYNIKVVNLSLGAQEQSSYTLSPLSTAVEVLSFAGITVVVSAGNSGPGAGTITTPGDDPFVITVGGIDDAGTASTADDSMATWSSCGPTTFDALAKPDLVAPGRHMISLRSPGSSLDTLFPARGVTAPGALTANYFVLSGTSMAAPLVAGAVALMLEKDPTLNPRQVKQRLVSGVTPLSFGTTMTRGAGMLNALTSVGSTDLTAWVDTSPVSDGFASLVFPLIAGQPLVWRDLQYNGGVDSLGIPWSAITWNDISWDLVTWNDISWDTISWEAISWETVAAQDISWDTAFDPLSSSGPGWTPLK